LGSCGLAVFGTIAFVGGGHGGELTLGLFIWALALGGVWAAVAQHPVDRGALA
jgi:hypothetical protein